MGFRDTLGKEEDAFPSLSGHRVLWGLLNAILVHVLGYYCRLGSLSRMDYVQIQRIA